MSVLIRFLDQDKDSVTTEYAAHEDRKQAKHALAFTPYNKRLSE